MRYLYIVLFLCASAIAGEYHVDKSANNLVKFISDAPIEDFEGVTNSIDGYLYFEGDSLLNQSQLYFEVDLNTVDTGIGLRNRHMRENYLHTDKYPKAHYTAKLVKIKKLNKKEYEVEAEGIFFIHGIEQQKTIIVKLEKIIENKFKISAQFVIALSDYNIEIPSIMFYKIDENMDLFVEFYLNKVSNSEGESE